MWTARMSTTLPDSTAAFGGAGTEYQQLDARFSAGKGRSRIRKIVPNDGKRGISRSSMTLTIGHMT